MSEQAVAVVREMLDCFAAGDRESWREQVAEDIVWDTSGTEMPNAGVYHGHAGVERFFVDWLGTWLDLQIDFGELIDGGDQVVSVFRWSGRGRSSGVETKTEMYGVYEVRGGKVVGFRQYDTRADAFAAVGLDAGGSDGS